MLKISLQLPTVHSSVWVLMPVGRIIFGPNMQAKKEAKKNPKLTDTV